MSCNFKTNKTMEEFNNKRKKDYRAEIWTGILMVVMFTIIFLGSCKKQDIEPINIPCNHDIEEYEFSESDLNGTWATQRLIVEGRIVSTFDPQEHILSIEDGYIGVYLGTYYTTKNLSELTVTEDSLLFTYRTIDTVIYDAFRYKYKHDSSLVVYGESQRNQSVQFDMTRD